MIKVALCAALLMASTSLTSAFEKPKSLEAYTLAEKQAFVQGVAGIGTLAFCEINKFYVSTVGPVAFERMITVVQGADSEQFAAGVLGVFRQAREDGTIPMFADGKQAGEFTATDEAGCHVVEDLVSKLMAPKGLLDIEPALQPDEQKS